MTVVTRPQPGGMPQLGEEPVRGVVADHVVAHSDSYHCRRGDLGLLAADDPRDAVTHDRQHAFHLLQNVFGLGLGQRAQ